jgi:hypothetical protein
MRWLVIIAIELARKLGGRLDRIGGGENIESWNKIIEGG